MRLLLDTCSFIWLTQEPSKLSPAAQSAINDPSNSLALSHPSAWEMHLKHHSGKLTLPQPPRQWIRQQLAEWRIAELTIQLEAISVILQRTRSWLLGGGNRVISFPASLLERLAMLIA